MEVIRWIILEVFILYFQYFEQLYSNILINHWVCFKMLLDEFCKIKLFYSLKDQVGCGYQTIYGIRMMNIGHDILN